MISRSDRDRLIHAINRYIGGDSTSFVFDDELSEIANRTNDDTVKNVTELLWCLYDDLEDHKVVAGKPTWDLIQRYILLLKSDGELRKRSQWTIRQALALAMLLIFIAYYYRSGFGFHLLRASIPLGLGSIAISRWQQNANRPYEHVSPFGSTREIRNSVTKAKGYRKHRYPREMSDRTIREPVVESLMLFKFYIGWLVISPVALLFQSFPESNYHHLDNAPDKAL